MSPRELAREEAAAERALLWEARTAHEHAVAPMDGAAVSLLGAPGDAALRSWLVPRVCAVVAVARRRRRRPGTSVSVSCADVAMGLALATAGPDTTVASLCAAPDTNATGDSDWSASDDSR